MRDIYAKLLLLFNLGQHLPGGDLRGFQLHLWKKRGVFKNMISRQYGPKQSIPDKPIFSELKVSADETAEIDFRFEALRPYLKAERLVEAVVIGDSLPRLCDFSVTCRRLDCQTYC